MKEFNNPNELNIFNAPPPPPIERDFQGRTLADIKKACKSLKDSVLNSITLQNNHWYIEGQDADEWIAVYDALYDKDQKEYWNN